MRFALALAALAALLMASLSLGERMLPPGLVIDALRGAPGVPADTGFIVTRLRLPRALMALSLGAALALAGAICQAALRNPLAEPGLIGINSGASLAVMVLLVGLPGLSALWLAPAALAGAALVAGLILALSLRAGQGSQRMILIGLAISAFCGGLSAFLASSGDIPRLQRAMLWMAGSLQDSRPGPLALLLCALLPLAALALLMARRLDLFALGDEVAHGLGLAPLRARAGMLALAAALAAASVAAAGPVGFVGLVAPHLARWLGGPAHLRLLPMAALIGALLLMAADLTGRLILAPAQVPAGIVAALVGAPFLGILLWRHRHD